LKDAYEWGCPARGVVSPAGECKDNGKGIQSMCYSTSRYEAGPDMPCDSEEKCFCVKPENSNGNAMMKFHHTEIKDGKVLVMGKFTKERENKCQECEQHDQDQKTCNECKNCEYFVDGPHKRCNRRVDLGIPKKQQDIPDTSERELKILPHFRIWDPGEEDANIKDEMQPSEEQETTIQMPYTNRCEPLTQAEWRMKFKEVAPDINRILESTAKQIKEEWAPNASSLDCFDPAGKGGSDIPGKLDRFLAIQNSCKQMQEIAQTIAPGSNSEPLKCLTTDEKLDEAIHVLQVRNQSCFKAGKYLDQEEKKNGPPPVGADERSEAGRVRPQPGVQINDDKEAGGAQPQPGVQINDDKEAGGAQPQSGVQINDDKVSKGSTSQLAAALLAISTLQKSLASAPTAHTPPLVLPSKHANTACGEPGSVCSHSPRLPWRSERLAVLQDFIFTCT